MSMLAQSDEVRNIRCNKRALFELLMISDEEHVAAEWRIASVL